MKSVRILAFIALLLVVVPFVHANGVPVTMVFTGVNGVNNGLYYVSPYYGTMNGKTVTLFCDDILNDVHFGQTWSANVTNLGTALGTIGGFSNTRYGGVSSSAVYSNAAVAYQEAAWLTTQFATHKGDYISLQYALWDIMNPGSEPTSYGDVAWWLSQAKSNYSSINPNNFEVVTNVGPLRLTCQVQEFIVATAEPSAMLLLVFGMLAFASVSLVRRAA